MPKIAKESSKMFVESVSNIIFTRSQHKSCQCVCVFVQLGLVKQKAEIEYSHNKKAVCQSHRQNKADNNYKVSSLERENKKEKVNMTKTSVRQDLTLQGRPNHWAWCENVNVRLCNFIVSIFTL